MPHFENITEAIPAPQFEYGLPGSLLYLLVFVSLCAEKTTIYGLLAAIA
jgi:hypothetical protein